MTEVGRLSPFILHDFWCSVTDGTTRRLSDLVPNDLGQAKVGDLDPSDTTASSRMVEFSFILLFLVVWSLDWVFRRDDRDTLE